MESNKYAKSKYSPKSPDWKIVYYALIYITTSKSENDMAKEYGVPRTTLQRYLNDALPQYDEKLAKLVKKKTKHMVNGLSAQTYRLDATTRSKLKKSNAVSVFSKLLKKDGKRDRTIRGKSLSTLIWG